MASSISANHSSSKPSLPIVCAGVMTSVTVTFIVLQPSQAAAYQDDADTWTTDKRGSPQLQFRGIPRLIIPDNAKSSGDLFDLCGCKCFLKKILQETIAMLLNK
uniref:Uncharacterized protein n=1 Tax=Glossina pallidipes TaxID=7398 RepID=A0A1A9Z8K6_GLOPL